MGEEETTRRRRVEVFVEASLDDDTWLDLQADVRVLIEVLMEEYEPRELRYRFEHTIRNEEGQVYV